MVLSDTRHKEGVSSWISVTKEFVTRLPETFLDTVVELLGTKRLEGFLILKRG